MPKIKQKTHKGTAKVCKVRPGGTVKIGVTGTLHNTANKSANVKRKKRKGGVLSHSDRKRIKGLLQK